MESRSVRVPYATNAGKIQTGYQSQTQRRSVCQPASRILPIHATVHGIGRFALLEQISVELQQRHHHRYTCREVTKREKKGYTSWN
jgi:hypothetical protein